MTRRTAGPARGGFTMIELLVVILIIAVLVGLLVPAISSVRSSVKKAECANDIAQLVNAHQAFMSKFRPGYIPSGGGSLTGKFRLCSTYSDASQQSWPELIYLKQIFPQMNLADNGLRLNGKVVWSGIGVQPANSVGPQELDGNQLLVFFLSGSAFTGYQGFSTNKQQPFNAPQAASGEERVGPFFEFKPAKLNAQSQYLDPWGTPYAYFSAGSRGNDYAGAFSGTVLIDDQPFQFSIQPLFTYINPNNPNAGNKYQQPKGFQIISAGPNQKFGAGGAWTPGSGDYARDANGGDDLCNFNNGNPLFIAN